MKIKYSCNSPFVIAIVIVLGFIPYSCSSTPQEISAEHENIIGTKWVSVVLNSADSLEFVDRTNCIFINNGKELRVTYTVKEGRIIIGNNLLQYELRGDTIYLIGHPAYKKR